MKKILCLTVLCSILVFGCGGDDNGGGPGPGPTTPTVTANTTVGSPTLTDPNHIAWSSVVTTTVNISGATPKLAPLKSSAVSDNVKIQAIVSNDTLFMRVRWNDDDYSVWPRYFEVSDANPPISFTGNPIEDEDHLFVMFLGEGNFGWDVWNWRSYTTDAGNLAEGFVFNNNTLTTDEGAAYVAWDNSIFNHTLPKYLSVDTSDFNSHILYLEDTLNRLDTNIYGNPVTATLGWEQGQRIPSFLIDTTLDNYTTLDENRRRSRFDIRAVSSYNMNTNEYTVVLSRKLNTGFADDIDLSTLGTVTIKIGIFNNVLGYEQQYFSGGDANKGFTPNINLVLQ